MKELKDDIGMDLYTSGARGSVGNHLKNMYLMRGAVQNPYTKEYEIITNSLCDGLAKKDISIHSNVITSGAFPKAVNVYRQPLNHVNCWNIAVIRQSAAKI